MGSILALSWAGNGTAMTTPEERREGQIGVMRDHMAGWPVMNSEAYRETTNQATVALNALLAHLDETDPKVAHALRYGIPDSVPMEVIEHGLREVKTEDSWLFHPQTGEGLNMVADEVELLIVNTPETDR